MKNYITGDSLAQSETEFRESHNQWLNKKAKQ